jgi:hypothetical protein
MKRNWKKNVTTILISTLLMTSAISYPLFGGRTSILHAAAAQYQLTDTIKAEVKSILNERVSEGARIGAVIRLFNQGSQLIRVPDYEVRIKTDNGVEYTLRPSAANTTAIQPQEKVELSYMITVDRSDSFSLTELSWISLDEFSYPQIEKKVLSVPVSSNEWRGDTAVFTDPSVLKKWGEPFTIPVLSSALEYTPVNLINQNTPKGPAAIVVFLVENKGKLKEIIPDFRIDGKSDAKVYTGNRIEQDKIALEPGEKRNIHFAVMTENSVDLRSLNVLTPESFAMSNETNINYNVGRLNIQLPGDGNGGISYMDQLEPYAVGSPIKFDPLNKLIQQDVDISLVELHMHEGEGDGYKTAIAKFKLNNRGASPLPVPNFQAELMSADGYSYAGSRQTIAAQTLIPNLSYIISYSFNVPSTETGERLGMKVMDSQTAAPYNIPIAAFRTNIQKEDNESLLTFYPFNVKLKEWTLGAQLLAGSLTYSYKLILDLEIERQDNIVIDQNFSKLKVELVDTLGRILGSESSSFTGENRLVSGRQIINFTNLRSEQFEYPLTIHVYETIETPFGEAKRLVKTLQQ